MMVLTHNLIALMVLLSSMAASGLSIPGFVGSSSTNNDFAAQLSNLPVAPSAEQITSQSSPIFSLPQPALQSIAIVLTYISCVIAVDRPQGAIMQNHEAFLPVQKSQVPEAGLGLFAGASMPEGTVLGTYAGVVRPSGAYRKKKLQAYPCSNTYIWRFTDNMEVIDPTNIYGQLDEICCGGSDDWLGSCLILNILSRILGKTTKLARINEPPIGRDCNVRAEEDLNTRCVVFSLARDVFPGEELYIDYGLTYDRSNYQG
jgi:hypothetical protein